MTGEKLVRCHKHNTTGLESCPACDQELGKGVYEDRDITLHVSAEVSWLKGLRIADDGGQENVCSTTDHGWDDVAGHLKTLLNHRKGIFDRSSGSVNVLWVEVE